MKKKKKGETREEWKEKGFCVCMCTCVYTYIRGMCVCKKNREGRSEDTVD